MFCVIGLYKFVSLAFILLGVTAWCLIYALAASLDRLVSAMVALYILLERAL